MKACLEVGEFRLASTLSHVELENVESVLVLSWVAVFGGQTVVDGDDNRRDLACEPAANVVVGLEIGGEIDEATAVEEDDDGERSVRLRITRDEEPEPEVAGLIGGNVKGFNAVAGFGIGRLLEAVGIDERKKSTVDGAVAAAGGVAESPEEEESDARLPGKYETLMVMLGRFGDLGLHIDMGWGRGRAKAMDV
ncbi:hypothetical protein Salat_2573800 [Sesamum alatum]|uniref:Uncharacterized protein n=1 Tax=Sesamum alatum TaxID=300844 RepID=A0AAE1XTT2_9LAMI|nr:hypothetical protein Salat_2573800 [Sesamum alatum]